MFTRSFIHLAAATALFTTVAVAEESTFQNGVNGYSGYRQAVLQGNFESRRTEDLSSREELKAMGVPHGGQQTFFLLRFDDLFNPEKGGLPVNTPIRSARLELYKIREEAASPAFDGVPPAMRVVYVYMMRTPFYTAKDSDDGGYSCFSYRRYGGSGDELYWGNEHRITDGPVREVDYEREPVAEIPIEPDPVEPWYCVDVTLAISEARERGDKTGGHGFLIMSPHYWFGLVFASGEATDKTLRPKLVIEY